MSKKSTEWFKEKVRNYHGEKVEILSEYAGSENPIDIVYHCNKHGDTYTTLNAKNICKEYFLPCKQCQSENKRESSVGRSKNKDECYKNLKKYCESRGGYVVSKKWTTAKDPYTFKCSNPEHPEFESTADALMNGKHWCPYCSGRSGSFEKEIKKLISSKNGELLSQYKRSQDYVTVKCNEHNYVWDITPTNLKKGRWCPVCNLPFSEKVVFDYLRNNGLDVRVQYKFDNLIGENNEAFRFDFAILNTDLIVRYLIEVDDCEHRYDHKQPRRILAHQRDIQKNNYCKINKIPLFRMDYWFNKTEISYEDYYKYIDAQLNNIVNTIRSERMCHLSA